ncbi:MAG: hypothetical protein ACOVMN_07935 [Flexibacteraceae bacterium]
MKIRLSVLAILLVTTFNSCIYNFEDGADFSLRSIGGRLAGKWTIKGVWVNGIDSSGFAPYLQYTKNDSLVLDFNYNIQYGSEKVNHLTGSVGYQGHNGNYSDWYPYKKQIHIRKNIFGFNEILFEYGAQTEWNIIECRKNRFVLELDRYYLYNQYPNYQYKKIRILLLPF